LLILGGLLGFLPLLGFWMIPLGFSLLAMDFPVVRRLILRCMTALKIPRKSAGRRATEHRDGSGRAR
jgi:hypothetical protein